MSDDGNLKQRIHDGELVIGVFAPIRSNRSQIEAILSKDSYDFVWVDSQHTAFNEEGLVEFCAITEELDIPVWLRIKNTRHAYLIGNLLDLGPSGAEVPFVENESTVDEALEAFYYPKVGRRSSGGAARRGIQSRPDDVEYERDPLDRVAEQWEYAEWWNSYGVLCMQIESVDGVTNARRLAKPGVDCLTWGSVDLGFSLKGYPEHPFKTDDDCVRHVLKQLEGSDTVLCYRSHTPDRRQKYIDMGVTVLMEVPRF